jgi:hypothetical protein
MVCVAVVPWRRCKSVASLEAAEKNRDKILGPGSVPAKVADEQGTRREGIAIGTASWTMGQTWAATTLGAVRTGDGGGGGCTGCYESGVLRFEALHRLSQVVRCLGYQKDRNHSKVRVQLIARETRRCGVSRATLIYPRLADLQDVAGKIGREPH